MSEPATAPATTVPRKRSHRPAIAAVAAAAVAAVTIWYITRPDNTPTRALTVLAYVQGVDNIEGDYMNCHGSNTYNSFSPGQPASLLDRNGKLVAVTSIKSTKTVIRIIANEDLLATLPTGDEATNTGRAFEKATKPFRDASGVVCAMAIVFEHVPTTGLYTIEVGDEQFPVDAGTASRFHAMEWTIG